MSGEKWYYLKKGELIKKGDFVGVSEKYNQDIEWRLEDERIGELAPDPKYLSHRIYRRKTN